MASRALVPVAFATLLAAMTLVSRCDYHHGFTTIARTVRTGDEPHYLLVVNSLLFDRDLELGEDYQRVWAGGDGAGRAFRGARLDHHTILAPAGVLWHDVYDWQRPIDCDRPCVGFALVSPEAVRGGVAHERSAHPVMFPALVALLVAPSAPGPEQVENRALLVNVLFSWLAAVATYVTCRRLGSSRRYAWLAVGLLVVASPWLAYARSFFSEPLAGLMLIAALGLVTARRAALAGLAIVVAAATKPTFALVGFGFIAALWLVDRRREAVRLAVVLAIGGGALMLFNLWQTGHLLVAGSTGWEWVDGIGNLGGTLISIRYGLLVFVPWTILAWIALGRGLRTRSALPVLVGLPAFATLVMLLLFGQLGGTCYGPRYWVPFLPWFAVVVARTVEGAPERTRRWWFVGVGILGGAAAVLALPSAVMYQHVTEVWDQPPHAALWAMLGF